MMDIVSGYRIVPFTMQEPRMNANKREFTESKGSEQSLLSVSAA